MADLTEAQATANIRRVARQRLGPAEASTRHASEAVLGSINALHVSEALTVARYRRAQDAAFRARVQQAKTALPPVRFLGKPDPGVRGAYFDMAALQCDTTRLDLKDQSLSLHEATRLGALLQSNKVLTALTLSKNAHLEERAVGVLGDALGSGRAVLEHLDLRACGLDERAVAALVAPRRLPSNRTLVSLDLRGNEPMLTAGGALLGAAVCAMLAVRSGKPPPPLQTVSGMPLAEMLGRCGSASTTDHAYALASLHLGPPEAAVLMEVAARCPRLTSLNLDWNPIESDGLVAIATHLTRPECVLRALSLGGTSLGGIDPAGNGEAFVSAGYRALWDALPGCRTLESLTLSDNTFVDPSGAATEEEISPPSQDDAKAHSRVRALILARGYSLRGISKEVPEFLPARITEVELAPEYNPEGIPSTFDVKFEKEAVRYGSKKGLTLDELLMFVNHAAVRVLAARMSAVATAIATAPLAAAAQMLPLRELRLRRCGLTARCLKLLKDWISADRRLTALDLAHNPLRDDGVGVVASAMKGNDVMVRLGLDHVGHVSPSTRGRLGQAFLSQGAPCPPFAHVSLDLYSLDRDSETVDVADDARRANQVVFDDAVLIGASCRTNPVLTWLDLSGSRIGTEGTAVVLLALTANLNNNIVHLGLSGVNCGCEGGPTLATTLPALVHLETLRVRDAALTEDGNDTEGGVVLARTLRDVPTAAPALQTLDVAGNVFDFETIQTLAEAFRLRPALAEVDMSPLHSWPGKTRRRPAPSAVTVVSDGQSEALRYLARDIGVDVFTSVEATARDPGYLCLRRVPEIVVGVPGLFLVARAVRYLCRHSGSLSSCGLRTLRMWYDKHPREIRQELLRICADDAYQWLKSWMRRLGTFHEEGDVLTWEPTISEHVFRGEMRQAICHCSGCRSMALFPLGKECYLAATAHLSKERESASKEEITFRRVPPLVRGRSRAKK